MSSILHPHGLTVAIHPSTRYAIVTAVEGMMSGDAACIDHEERCIWMNPRLTEAGWVRVLIRATAQARRELAEAPTK